MQTGPAWYLGTSWNLLEPLLGTLTWNFEPFGAFTWNPYLESRKPLEPSCRTLTWNFGTFRNLTCTWSPYLEPRNLRNLQPLVAWNLYLEPLLGTSSILHLQPLLGALEPSRNSLEPLLVTSEPGGTLRDDCPECPMA